MKIVDSLSRSVNYGMTSVDHAVKKIVSNPGTVKKVMQIAMKTFDAIDLYYDRDLHTSEVRHIVKGSIDIIGFYATYKNLMYWLNLFSKESMDANALRDSISSSLCASHKSKKAFKNQEKLAEKVFAAVMANKAYHSKTEVLNTIQVVLQDSGYSKTQAQQIADRIIIKQKERPPVQLFYMVCFTAAELGSNILNLQKWQVLDLSKLAATIGGQSKIFAFAMDLGAGIVIGGVASVGLGLMVLESSYDVAVLAGGAYSAAKGKEKEKAYQELNHELFVLSGNTLDFVATAAPLLLALNPSTIVALAIVSKGMGIIRVLAN